MQIKTYKVNELCNSRIVKRQVLFDGIIHNDTSSELRIEISDTGEHDNSLSILLTDKIEMKKLRSILTHAINDKTYR